MVFFVCAVLFALCALPAFAEPTGEVIQPSYTGQIVQILVALLVVSFAVIALAWVVKRLGNASFLQQKNMRVVSVLPMGNREKIVLVSVEGQRLLLGVTSHNINRLHVFSPEEGITDKASETEVQSEEEKTAGTEKTEKWDFSKYLKKVTGEEQGQ